MCIRDRPDHSNFEELKKEVFKVIKLALIKKVERLRDKKYQKLVEVLYQKFGFERDSWNLDRVKNFDDQSAFLVSEQMRNQVVTRSGGRIKMGPKKDFKPTFNTIKEETLQELKEEPNVDFSEVDSGEFFKMLDNWRANSESKKNLFRSNTTPKRFQKEPISQEKISKSKTDFKIPQEWENFNHIDDVLGISDSADLRKEIDNPTGVCVQNANSLSTKEYLKAFAKSKCSPIMITPGIFSTKLVVQINCQKMMDNSPELFRTCGWTGCSQNFLNRIPNDEYIIWVPDILDNLNLLSMNQAKNNCWVKFFSMPLNQEAVKNKDIPNVFKDTWELGWRVRLFGDTKGSDENHKCGSSAIEYLLPYNISADSLGGTKGILDGLRVMGYRDGLTLQGMPYDFRIASGLNLGYKRSFKESLIRMKELTGKKTIVMAHSFGTVNTYSAILDLTPHEKKVLIEFWAPVGGPLMGNSELMSTMVTGDNPMSLFNGLIGLTKQQALKTFYESTFSFELLPFDYWKFSKETWFKKFVLKRLLAENRADPVEVSRPNFFPNPSNECYKKLEKSGINCSYLSGVFPGKKIIHLKNKSYELSEVKEFLNDLDYTFDDNPTLKLADVHELVQGNYRDYPNPEVPVVGFFYNFKPTKSEIFFNEDKFDFNKKQKEKNSFFTSGDATVETYSAVIPMMKWAYEFSYRMDVGEYPVKFVDICSKIGNKTHPFDSDQYANNFKNNSYIGKIFYLNIFANY